jgi:hypothetical protein
MQIQVKYTEILKQVLGMIFIPAIMVLLFIFAMIKIKVYDISESMMTAFIVAGTLVVVGISVFIVLKILIAPATLDYDSKGIYVNVLANSWLFNSSIYVEYANLKQFSAELDTNGRAFMSVKVKSPKKSFFLLPENKLQDESFLAVGKDIMAKVEAYNSSQLEKGQAEAVISKEGFYKGKGMTILAYIFIVVLIAATAAKFYDTNAIPSWRLIFLYSLGIPFVFKVFKSASQNNLNEK